MTTDNPHYREPYYEHGGVTIYHGDCRDILPDLTADVVLTDLPYAIGVDYGPNVTDDTDNLNALIADVLPLMRAAAPVCGAHGRDCEHMALPAADVGPLWYQSNALRRINLLGVQPVAAGAGLWRRSLPTARTRPAPRCCDNRCAEQRRRQAARSSNP